MKKIVIIADSLSLPRPESHGNIPYEETYPYLLDVSLRNQLGTNAPIIMEKGKRGRTITEVVDDWQEYVSWRKPDIVIVQAGIVDCAPRVFLPNQRDFVGRIRIRFIREILLKLVSKYRRMIIKTCPNKVYTPLPIYRDAATKLTELAKQDNVQALIFINIVFPPDFLESKSPGFQENVRLYNEALEQCKAKPGVYVVDLNGLFREQGNAEGHLLYDGHHLSVEGNRCLAKHLEYIVTQLLADSPADMATNYSWLI